MSLERHYTLTPKQIRFAELVALEGYKLVHAWRTAYDTAPDTPMTTARPAASKLAQTPAWLNISSSCVMRPVRNSSGRILGLSGT